LSQQRSFLDAARILEVDYRIVQNWTHRFREWLLELDPTRRMEASVRLGMIPDLGDLVCPACKAAGGLVHYGFVSDRKAPAPVRRQFRCTACRTFTSLDEPSMILNLDDKVRGSRSQLLRPDGEKARLSHRGRRRSVEELESTIIERSKAGETFASIARSLNIDRSTVSRVVRHEEAMAVSGPRRLTGAKQLLTGAQKQKIRQRRAGGKTLKALAEGYGVSIGLIHRLIKASSESQ
jgi:transposase-like protein